MADAPDQLYAEARALLELAYAPYSTFQVGALLVAADGATYPGVNVENGAYPQTLCAERSAVAGAVSRGARRFTDLVIAYRNGVGNGTGGYIRPCGGCLSVLQEFSPDGSLRVHCLDERGGVEVRSLRELLPYPFELRG
ncbi:MAG TPA: cytidine deaminase [bacterium]|nr:cytidine deaminase [bacterium]